MKKNLLSSLLISCSVTILVSCQKDILPNPAKIPTEAETKTESIKRWYLSSTMKGARNSNNNYVGDPNWDKVSLFKPFDGSIEFIRYPLDNYLVNKGYTPNMFPTGFRDIIFRKEGDNYIVDILEVHPDNEYVLQKKDSKLLLNPNDLREVIDNYDFTGYFLVFNSNNQLRYGERRINGQLISTLGQ